MNTSNDSLQLQLDQALEKVQFLETMMIEQSRLAIMGEMIGMIAHQWRQPITIIGMVTNNTILDIQIGNLNESQILEDMTLIDKQVHFLSRTIDDFRNFFRQNKLPQAVTMNELSNELLTIFGKTFENSQISLNFQGDMADSFITYKNEMLQVFLNILGNAKDAFDLNSISKRKIDFLFERNDDSIIFKILDNAGGIDPTIIEKIFDPYFTTKPDKSGTGLGLYMSSIIIEKHLHGTIEAKNQENGVCFTITLPIIDNTERSNVY